MRVKWREVGKGGEYCRGIALALLHQVLWRHRTGKSAGVSVQPHRNILQGGCSERPCLAGVFGREEGEENCPTRSLRCRNNYWAPFLGCLSGPFKCQLGKPDLTACVSAESGSGGRRQNVRLCGLLAQLPNSSKGKVLILPGKSLVGPRQSKFLGWRGHQARACGWGSRPEWHQGNLRGPSHCLLYEQGLGKWDPPKGFEPLCKSG